MSTPRYIRAARRMSLGELDSFGRSEDDEDYDAEDDFDPRTEYDADHAADMACNAYERELDRTASQ